MSAGRSRGRARTSTVPTPAAPAGPTTETPTPIPVPQPVVPPTISSIVAPTTPRAQILPEAGRGRGAEPVQPTPPQSSAATTATSNEDSPPQQHSPPQKSSPPLAAPQSLGRAALRGAAHQPSVAARSELIGPMERLALQEPGDVEPKTERRADRIETVPFTRPASCLDKTGT